ncbi:hypothetical protein SAMN00017405_0891 [Desulfonispora thiosulfatigenes DSM 11270]|uniref:Helicase ATP-binding domain-containing protein n=1 Tax=Desulfonispora thiosulfatigenes DSM 11270 TaxID=656914 RepID=A0A1W1UHC8_DESTI|nr:DUF2075 domain-containing protein [Desulfonispora thiosulfatigenes]SMB80506.1 hypothetical protein SAMN00017405_0891 [Desulfonispora thiosulfatigenes DSM 11270]
MALIKSFEYNLDKLEDIKKYKYGRNWPVVYVLEGGKDAYVGETVHAYNRSCQHWVKEERKKLDFIHIIGDHDFNKSATLDIESLLIEHMAADGTYKLQNSNGGLVNHNYYDKEKYKSKFEVIWGELKKKGVVKKGLFELRNSDLFKYSPYKALNEQQCAVVNEIKESIIQNESSRHLIQGEPGTGKTIVAIYLMKQLKECEETKNLKVGLVVPMTSLRATLRKVFKSVKDLNSGMVLSPFDVIKDRYDILIVDEAHRLNRRVKISNMGAFDNVNLKLGLDTKESDQLDWIKLSAKHIILCYDGKQSVRPSDILPSKIEALNAKKHMIKSQMRVLGGQDYIEYIENILHMKQEENKKFSKYDFMLFDHIEDMYNQIRQRDQSYGLSRLVAGYAWEWKSKKDKNLDDIVIQGKGFKWNSVNKDWINSKSALDEVGCIHTIQGYDLNYTGVIIGKDIKYRNGKIVVDKDCYFDKYGKPVASDLDMLDFYILNIYKTLLTRGIRGTYVYVCDEELRMYLKRYIQTYTKQNIYLEDDKYELKVAEEPINYEK